MTKTHNLLRAVHRSASGRARRHHFRSRNGGTVKQRYTPFDPHKRNLQSKAFNDARDRLTDIRSTLPNPIISDGIHILADGSESSALVIFAPKNMSFLNNYDEMLGFIYARHWYGFVPGACSTHKMVSTDLCRVKSIELDAALVLVADYHSSLLIQRNYKPYINDDQWLPEVRAVLDMMGFYELVEATGRTMQDEKRYSSPLKFVPFVSADKVLGEKADELIESLKVAAGRTPKRVAIYAALVEAIKNVYNHAYPSNRPTTVVRGAPNWWAAGAYNPDRNELTFAVYDQGVGIPFTLPRMSFFQAVLQRCPPEFNDADVIAGAIDYGRTSTDMLERGNGLWTICKLVEELPGSQVRLMSGRGQVTYTSKGAVHKKLQANPFYGTLIQWSLILPKEEMSAGAAR